MWARGSQRCLIAFVLQVMVVLLIGAALVRQTFQRMAMDRLDFQDLWLEPMQQYLGGFQTGVLDWYPVGRSADERAHFGVDVNEAWDHMRTIRQFHQTMWNFPEGEPPKKRLAGKLLVDAQQLPDAREVDAELLRGWPQGQVLGFHSLQNFEKCREMRRNLDKYIRLQMEAPAMPPPLEMVFGHAILNIQQQRALQASDILKRKIAALKKMHQGQPKKYRTALNELKESHKKWALQQHRASGEKFRKAMPPMRPSEEQAYGEADQLHNEDLMEYCRKYGV